MNAWGISDQGRVRVQNQDAFFLHVFHEQNQAIAVICDGMGGANAGQVAATVAIEAFVEQAIDQIKVGMNEKQMKQVLTTAATHANRLVYERAHTDPGCDGMGTTLVAAMVSDFDTAFINIGDSRAYHIHAEGIRQVTRDHSLVEDMVAKGELTHDEARRHPSRNFITRALGTDAQETGELFFLSVEPGDSLLLCSDGLSNVVLDQEILYEVQQTRDPERVCRQLLETANVRGGPDNITVVMLAF